MEKVGQEQIHGLLFDDRLSWQAIIYDLINTEQLDPWNIDLTILAQKYLVKVRELEEANFFISSKVLLAASLLLRIKSEIVLNEDIPALDDILFGREKEGKVSVQERIELDGEVPGLIPKSPLPRFRRISLEELMSALGQAIKTETRRIHKDVIFRQQEYEVQIAMPKKTVNLKDHIERMHRKLLEVFSSRNERVAFSELVSGEMDRYDKIIAFVSLLHLDTQQRVWLEQEGHFEEILVWLKALYESVNADKLEGLRKEVDEFMRDAEKEQEESDKSASDTKVEKVGESIEDDVPVGFVARDRVENNNEEEPDG